MSKANEQTMDAYQACIDRLIEENARYRKVLELVVATPIEANMGHNTKMLVALDRAARKALANEEL